MSKEWMTAQEIADAGLPNMPTTKRGVLKMAAREDWDQNPAYSRNREGRGGGMEYHFRILPTLAQIAFNQRHMVVSAVDDPTGEPLVEADEPLSERAQLERDARLAILSAFDRFSKGLPLGLHSRLQVFTDKYSVNSLMIDAWVKDVIPQVSKRSLLRWRADHKAGKANNLAYDPSASRKGTGTLDIANDGAVKEFVLALIAFQPFLTAKHIRKQCGAKFGATLEVRGKPVALPNERAFQRLIAAFKADTTTSVALVKMTNPDLYRSTLAPAGVGTYRHITEPNELWMIDASPVDMLCTDGRHSMYGCIDIATRRLVITVSKTPRASAVALMIRKAAMTWGIPQVIKTDNGSDFVAHATQRLFNFLDISIDVSDAYTPQQKGHIERAIGTFQRDLTRQMPGFVGHSIPDRKAIESRKSFAKRLGESEAETFGVVMTAAELQVHIDRWLEVDYHQSKHAGLKGLTPAMRAAQSTAKPRMVDERAFDVLLMPVAGKDGQRTTTKFGVRIGNFHYATPDILPGTPVFVRQDPLDAGRAYAFTPDASLFIGMAYCAELAGINPADLMKQTRETHAAIIETHMKSAKAEIRNLGKRPLIEASLAFSASQMPNVIAMPKRTVEHSTPQIAAAIAATTVKASTVMDERTAAEQRRMIEEMNAEEVAASFERVQQLVADREDEIAAARIAHLPTNANVVALPESPKEKYRRALALKEAIDAGAEIEPVDAYWLGQFEATPEFRGQHAVHQQFGDDYLAL